MLVGGGRPAFAALVVSAVVGAAVAPAVRGAGATSSDAATPPGKTNGPLVYEAGGGPVAITTIGTDEQKPGDALTAASIDFPLEGSSPVWWASGLRLAFTRRVDGRRQIFVSPGDDGKLVRQLTKDPAEAIEPTWAPDGMSLAFTSSRHGRPEIYSIAVDGSGEQRLTDDPADAAQPDWSATGRQIAFVSTRNGSFDIWRMRSDGSRQVPVTTSPGREIDPDWRDGRILAFAGETGVGTSIFMIDRDGTGRRQLTDAAVDRFPSWSPMGDAIAFTRTVGANDSTFVTSTGADALNDEREEIPRGTRADWGALAQPPSDPLLLGTSAAAVTPEKGSVTVTPPQSQVQTPLNSAGARVPLGYVVHAPGAVELTANAAPTQAGRAPTASVRASVTGTFELEEPGQDDPAAVTLRLRGPGLRQCSGQAGLTAGAAKSKKAKKKTKKKRKVNKKKKVKVNKKKKPAGGKVSTIGGHSKGTASGTIWTTEETCAGTLTTVQEGVVLVEDFGRGITVAVRAGQRYLARR